MHTSVMAAPSPLDHYLDEVQRIRATGAGTGETTYYPAVVGVLNLVGAGLWSMILTLCIPSPLSGWPGL